MEAYIGEIRQFAGNFAPEGWAICDGSLLPLEANETLFSIIGNSFGGDGVKQFALPDLRGRVIVSRTLTAAEANKSGVQHYPFGSLGGQEKVTLTYGNLPKHEHDFMVSPKLANTKLPNTNTILAMPVEAGVGIGSNPNVIKFLPNNPVDSTQKLLPMSPATLSPSGNKAPTAHENRMPYAVINFIICIVGTYPEFND